MLIYNKYNYYIMGFYFPLHKIYITPPEHINSRQIAALINQLPHPPL